MDISNTLSDVKLAQQSGVPLYLQLANNLAAKIQTQRIPAGTKLPPERELAKLFGVSRTTAINAYRRLEEQQLVATRVGSGTYVTASPSNTAANLTPMPWEQLFAPYLNTPLSSIIRLLIATPTANDTISLAAGMPDPSMYPAALFNSPLTDPNPRFQPPDLGHIPTEGYWPLRKTIAGFQQTRGMDCSGDNILVVAGSQQGLYLINKVFIEPGDYVIVDSPSYIGAIQIFQSAGARILSLPCGDRLPFDLLEDYLIRYRPKLLYTIPTFHNPTGKVMSLDERKKLLGLAARHRLIIVEDDPYSELYYDQQPPSSLKSLDPYGGVLYLGTFSKSVCPGLRIGWLNAPPAVINRLAQEKQYVDLHCNNLAQWQLYTFLESGRFDSHLADVRKEYKKRRDAAAGSIRRWCGDSLRFELPGGGFYLWCGIERNIAARDLLQEASKAGVTFVPGEAFYAGQGGSHQFRLCFATHDEALISEGIKRLAKILAKAPRLTADHIDTAFVAGKPLI